MSEHTPDDSYPDSEHCAHVDFFETPLPQIVLRQQEQITEAEGKAKRWDEGVMMMEWHLSRLPAQNCAVLTPSAVMGMLGNIAVYSVTAQKCPWMERACMDMGWRP